MKNRTIIGITCMVFAIAITFLVAPLVTRMTSDSITVLCVAEDLKQGVQITEADIITVEAKTGSTPEGAITEKAHIIGRYATSNLFAGDFYTASKLKNEANTASDVFALLDGSQVAISFTIENFAAGLSGKLENGDIISIIVTEQVNDKTFIPTSLKYVRVITTTTSGGIDKESVVFNDDGTYDLPSTVTVLVTPEQAQVIAGYEDSTKMQTALVYRGDKEKAQKFLDKQTEYLMKGATTDE